MRKVRKGNWTHEDYVRLMDGMEINEREGSIAWDLNRTIGAVKGQAQKIKRHIRKDSKKRRWEEFEIAYLQDKYNKMSAQAIAERLNRSVGSILHKFKAINYKKIPDMNALIDNIDDYYNHECYNMKLEVGATYNIERGIESAKYPLLKGECTCIDNNYRHILFQNNKSGVKESILKVDIFHRLGVTVTKVEEES